MATVSCSSAPSRSREVAFWLTALTLLGLLLAGCRKDATLIPGGSPRTKTFVSQNFFSLEIPADWETSDMDDGANLFFADEQLYIRIKILEPPNPNAISDFVAEKIKIDADVQGGQATLLRIGHKSGVNPFSSYLISKQNGQRFQEFLVYNESLRLLFVLLGSSRPEDFDEFTRVFDEVFESFQFRVTARVPFEDGTALPQDYSSIAGVWVAYLRGLYEEDFTLLEKSCAGVNSSKIISEQNVRNVKDQYFPYQTPVYTFISHVEVRDRMARAILSVRALPPEGYLAHETREFIKEGGEWRLLRFERPE